MKIFRSVALVIICVFGLSAPVYAAGNSTAAPKTEAEILQEQVAEQFL